MASNGLKSHHKKRKPVLSTFLSLISTGLGQVYNGELFKGILFKVIDMTIGLRVSREEELRGLDIGEHGMESYAGFEIFTTQ